MFPLFFWYSLQDHDDVDVLVLAHHLLVTDQCLGRARQNVRYHRSSGTSDLGPGDDLYLVVRWILDHVLVPGRFHRKDDPIRRAIRRKAAKRDDNKRKLFLLWNLAKAGTIGAKIMVCFLEILLWRIWPKILPVCLTSTSVCCPCYTVPVLTRFHCICISYIASFFFVNIFFLNSALSSLLFFSSTFF